MSRPVMAINSEGADWGWSEDAGERARLLQSPSVEAGSQARERQGGTSAVGAVFIVVNAALGAGLLNFPAAFNTAGGVTSGIVLQMCMLLFIISGLVILAYCSQVSNETTYQEVVRAVCGRVPGVICEVAIAVYTFGTCITFLIIIGDQLDKLVGAISHESAGAVSSGPWYTDRKFTIVLTSVLVILPLSIPKEIGFQKYASALSVIGTWYVTIVVIVRYIWPDSDVSPGYIPTSFQCDANYMFWIPVPREQRARVQQHEEAGDKALGCSGDRRHDYLSLRLHGHRRVWVPVIRLQREPGCADVVPLGRHRRGHRPGLHHPLRCHLLSHPALLRQGGAGGAVAAVPRRAGGGGRDPGAAAPAAADGGVVRADAGAGALHPRHRPRHLHHRGARRLLHLRLPRAVSNSGQAVRDPGSQTLKLVGSGVLWCLHGHPGGFHLWPDHHQCHLPRLRPAQKPVDLQPAAGGKAALQRPPVVQEDDQLQAKQTDITPYPQGCTRESTSVQDSP